MSPVGRNRHPPEPGASERLLIAWTTSLFIAGVLPQYLVGSLAVEIRQDFAFSDATLGVTVATAFTVAALMSSPAGRLVGRLGIRRSLLSVGAVFTCVPIAIALLVQSGLAMILSLALIGLGTGSVSPANAALFTGQIRSSGQGSAFGMLSAAPSLGALLAGLALPLIAEPFGWRTAFVAAGLLSAISVSAVLRLSGSGTSPGARKYGEALQGEEPDQDRPAQQGGDALQDNEGQPSGEAQRRGGVRGSMRVAAISAGLTSGAGLGMRSFMVVFAVSAGISGSTAGMILAGTGFAAVASRIVMGVLGDRRPGNHRRRAAGLMAMSAVGYLLMATSVSEMVVVGAFVAGGIGWGWNAPLTLAAVTENPEDPARAIAIQMTGFFIGAAVGPLLIGLLAQQADYQVSWLVCAVSTGIAALLLLAAARFQLGARRGA